MFMLPFFNKRVCVCDRQKT